MMTDELTRAILLYLRLVSYPAAIFGVLWLMLFRPDWRHRPTSLFYLALAVLQAAQFGTVIIRILSGEKAAVVAQDVLITPALMFFNLALWASILWLSRRWRNDPAGWV